MSQDFTKGKIYKITNDFNDDVYIGSTCDRLVKRFNSHKREAKKENSKNRPLYKLINNVGFDRFRIQLIEEFPCNDKYELRQREGHYIRELSKNLNKNSEGRTVKEYYKDNKEKIKETKKEYYKDNKEKIKERKQKKYQENKEKILENQKEYYDKNKEKISDYQKQYQKEYYEDNKEKILENNKEYYEKNKEQILEKQKEKINCVCGSCFCKGKLSKHNKIKKHIEFINNNNSSDSQIE